MPPPSTVYVACMVLCTPLFIVGKKMQIRTVLLVASLGILLLSCASYDFSRRVVQQGNLLPQSKLERLHLGLSKEDTAILMGTSLLSPLFNNDRWDYAYTFRKGSEPNQVRHLSLYFRDGRLSRIEHQP